MHNIYSIYRHTQCSILNLPIERWNVWIKSWNTSKHKTTREPCLLFNRQTHPLKQQYIGIVEMQRENALGKSVRSGPAVSASLSLGRYSLFWKRFVQTLKLRMHLTFPPISVVSNETKTREFRQIINQWLVFVISGWWSLSLCFVLFAGLWNWAHPKPEADVDKDLPDAPRAQDPRSIVAKRAFLLFLYFDKYKYFCEEKKLTWKHAH